MNLIFITTILFVNELFDYKGFEFGANVKYNLNAVYICYCIYIYTFVNPHSACSFNKRLHTYVHMSMQPLIYSI